MMVHCAAHANAWCVGRGRPGGPSKEGSWGRQDGGGAVVEGGVDDADCGGQTTCPRWPDGSGGDVSSVAFSQGGRFRLHLAAAIVRGSKAPGPVFSATDATCTASETSSGASALSSTVRTPPATPGSSAKAPGHCGLSTGRGAWVSKRTHSFAGLRVQVVLDARGCVQGIASTRLN